MIEIVYEKEKQKPTGNEGYFRIPNNIRQIGEVSGTQKIYIEDYAYTYLSRISNENMQQGCAAILLGQPNWKEQVSYLFIRSAIAIPQMEVSEEHVAFSEEIWNQVYEKSKEFFEGQEIVGWYLSIPGCSMELHEVICRTHINHFGGNDKVLLVMEPTEKEESFYRYAGGAMQRQPGYYIYYEKNEEMQNFLVSTNQTGSPEKDKVEDKAVKSFRKILENKTEERHTKRLNSFVYGTATCVLAGAILIGVVFLNDYDKLKNMEHVITDVTGSGQGTPAAGQESVSTGAAVDKKEGGQAEQSNNTAAKGQDSDTNNTQPGTDGSGVNGTQPGTDGSGVNGTQPGTDGSGVNGTQPEGNTEPQADANSDQTVADAASAGEQSVSASYTVRLGDTLTSISKQHYGTISRIVDICQANNMDPEQTIYPGQTILLP